MREIEIEWVQLGVTVNAELDGRNPKLADLLWESLPYNSLQNHALVSGNHLYHLAPIRELIFTQADRTEDRTLSPDGTVFLSQLQHLAVKYGPLSEYLPAAPVGRVMSSDLGRLKKAGEACWDSAYLSKELVEVRVRRKHEAAESYELPPPGPVADERVEQLLQDIHDETQRIWVTPPKEILNIHDGDISSRAGSYDQYFSTMVFVNGETRPLGYCALNGLIKTCQNTSLPLDFLRQLTPNFIRVPAEFLGYTGLHTLWSFTQRVLASLDLLGSKEDYFALISGLALYANSLNAWNLHYFPWRHGDDHRYL
ncbi:MULTISPECIES: hypothetical protein [unclassified Amycolatopsis]|uniref:cucumopine synthase-related protein n=1 Tax=unclassified Amycolatopsis TaxID=2618356 RepID=UPI00106E92ED|nr:MULTISPECIES: hypothetical protein [unclassified Amycolatopsis]